jgi:hypothetical protein
MISSRNIRSRITYANVASTVALALVVGGGTAYAAGLVGTEDIKKGAVTSPKIAKNAVTSKKVKNGTIKPADLSIDPVTSAVTRKFQIVFPTSPGTTGQYLTGFAACEAGEQVLGGGYDISPRTSVADQPNVTVQDSRPSGPAGAAPTEGSPATGWYVDARRNSGSSNATVDVWVLCGS